MDPRHSAIRSRSVAHHGLVLGLQVYPRSGTKAGDVCAPQAVLEAAGGLLEYSVVYTRSQRRWRTICEKHEKSSAPAKGRK